MIIMLANGELYDTDEIIAKCSPQPKLSVKIDGDDLVITKPNGLPSDIKIQIDQTAGVINMVVPVRNLWVDFDARYDVHKFRITP